MATKSNCTEETGLLRRAVAEPVRQFIVVEFDTLARLQQVLDELVALDPKRAHVIQKFDFRKDHAAGLLQIIREKLKSATGSRPAILALVGPDEIESQPGAPASQRFWKEMNLAREALNSFDAQILLCVERWSYRQALQLADHLFSWAAMKVHLIGASERPAVADRTVLSAGLFGDYKISPEVARERWSELEQSWRKAREQGEPAEGFLQRFFIPMLEAALGLGDLVAARKTRELAQEHGQFPDEDMPRWHELNLALALAEHEDDLANEHSYKLLDLAEHSSNERVRQRALIAVNNQANLLMRTAHYTLAELLLRKGLHIAEKTYGLEHPEVATRLNNLAQLLQHTNRLPEAEPLIRRAMAIDEEKLGPEHSSVGIHLNDLGALLRSTNRLAEAEPLLRRALVIEEKNRGPDYPEVATRLNNLAVLLQETNRLAEAETLSRRALAISEKTLGPEHPEVATRLNNLAVLLQTTNRLAEAEPLIRRALAINEKSLGPEHPTVAIHLNTLGLLLQSTERLAEAEPLFRRALAMSEKSLGPEHPTIATRLNNLGRLLQETNRLAEAEPLMRRALAIDEKSLGPEHPTVGIRLSNLASLLQDTNRLKDAEPLSRRAAAIVCRSLGPRHPKTQTMFRVYISILTDLKLSEQEIQAKLREVTGQSLHQ